MINKKAINGLETKSQELNIRTFKEVNDFYGFESQLGDVLAENCGHDIATTLEWEEEDACFSVNIEQNAAAGQVNLDCHDVLEMSNAVFYAPDPPVSSFNLPRFATNVHDFISKINAEKIRLKKAVQKAQVMYELALEKG